jgi:NAD(P)-dependent dehydrogenase (short-subunit alcohol dehydrogenase family)
VSDLRFDGRVIIITGAGRGLGQSHALEFARRGASVIVNDIDPSTAAGTVELIASDGGAAVAAPAAVETSGGAEAVVNAALESFGRLDVLVNNAAIFEAAPFGDVTRRDFERAMTVNVGGPWEMSRAVWPHFVEQGGGRIVITTSGSGLFGGPGHSSYAISKMALVGLMKSLAAEGEAADIRVNAIAPAAFTPTIDESTPAGAYKDWFIEHLPASAVSQGLVWLCHHECDLTGEIVGIYGGLAVRHVIGTTHGWVNPGFTAEEIRDQDPTIRATEHVVFPSGLVVELERIAQELEPKSVGGFQLLGE